MELYTQHLVGNCPKQLKEIQQFGMQCSAQHMMFFRWIDALPAELVKEQPTLTDFMDVNNQSLFGGQIIISNSIAACLVLLKLT